MEEDRSLEFLIQASAEDLDTAIEDASIPDIDPRQVTNRHYHYIGRRGDMEGEYFVRTLTTFELTKYDMTPDATIPEIEKNGPVRTSQIFGVAIGGEEVPIISVDIDFENMDDEIDLEEIPGENNYEDERAIVSFNKNWVALVDIGQFTTEDMRGYYELFSLIIDGKNHGLTQTILAHDSERVKTLLEEATDITRNSVTQEAEYYHLLARGCGYCAIESEFRGDNVSRRITAGDWVEGTEGVARIIRSIGNTKPDDFLEKENKVQPVVPAEMSAIDVLENFVYAKLAIRFCSQT